MSSFIYFYLLADHLRCSTPARGLLLEPKTISRVRTTTRRCDAALRMQPMLVRVVLPARLGRRALLTRVQQAFLLLGEVRTPAMTSVAGVRSSIGAPALLRSRRPTDTFIRTWAVFHWFQ